VLTLHHIGQLVADIEAARGLQVDRFGYEVVTQVIHDPLQAARVLFLRLPGERAFLELIAPDGPESPLQRALEQNVTLHHLCYSVKDLAQAITSLRKKGMSLAKKALPAVAFRGQPVAWLMGRDRSLVELLELPNPEDPMAYLQR
jgi:methylmalonyl-CoA/ethylmalonyl-CoA epimerase